jgi:hypothetical protein
MDRLSSDVADLVRSSLAEATKKVEEIRNGKPNYLVRDNDFLNPTIQLSPVTLDHPRGELSYYSNIGEAMKIALRIGAIPGKYMDYVIRAPKEITDLLERTDGRIA